MGSSMQHSPGAAQTGRKQLFSLALEPGCHLPPSQVLIQELALGTAQKTGGPSLSPCLTFPILCLSFPRATVMV